MAAGDTLRRIGPSDQFILDSSGNVVGIKSPNANGADLRFDPLNVAMDGTIGGADARPAMSVQRQSYHLRRTAAKLARANSAQVNIAVIGNSVAAGAYSNDAIVLSDTAWNQTGFVAVLRKYLATQFGTASLGGLLHPAENFATNFTVGGGAAQNGPNNSVGINGYRVDLLAAANTVQVTVVGRYARVWGFATTAGVAARYTLDGGSLTTVGTTSSGATPNGQFWYTFDIDMATDASHTLVLQGAASGSWVLYGVAGLSQLTTGAVVHRLGVSGTVVTELIASSLDATDTAGPAWRTTLSANGKEQQLQSITTRLGLDLAILMVDQNDLTGGWTTYGYSLADVKRHAQNAASALVGKGIDVLFVTGPWRSPASYGSGVPFTHADVIQQYADVAAATDRVAHLNLAGVYPDYAAFNTDGMMQDVVHPNSLGHAWAGKQIFRALMSL